MVDEAHETYEDDLHTLELVMHRKGDDDDDE
jgi:hypothetical protein